MQPLARIAPKFFYDGLGSRLFAAIPALPGLLIGVDLIKDSAVLDAAYADALGVTAAFDRNVLRRVNTGLDADFDVADWQHVAFYNALAARMGMHLEARRSLIANWPGATAPIPSALCRR